jgi:hypothetical protein
MSHAVVRRLGRPDAYVASQRPFIVSGLDPDWRQSHGSSIRRVLTACRAHAGVLKDVRRFVGSDHLQVIQLELPGERRVPCALALGRRGDWWNLPTRHGIPAEHFHEIIREPFAVTNQWPMLWSMVCFKGSPKANA